MGTFELHRLRATRDSSSPHFPRDPLSPAIAHGSPVARSAVLPFLRSAVPSFPPFLLIPPFLLRVFHNAKPHTPHGQASLLWQYNTRIREYTCTIGNRINRYRGLRGRAPSGCTCRSTFRTCRTKWHADKPIHRGGRRGEKRGHVGDAYAKSLTECGVDKQVGSTRAAFICLARAHTHPLPHLYPPCTPETHFFWHLVSSRLARWRRRMVRKVA